MNKNEQWLHMLAQLDVETTPDIETGWLMGRELTNNDKQWRIQLEFNRLIPFDKLNPILTKVKEYCTNNLNCEDCRFNITYRNEKIEDEDILPYYNDAIKVLSTVKREILILNRYTPVVQNGQIIINTNSEEEKIVVTNASNLILKYFNRYGLNSVTFRINVVDSDMDIMAKKEMALKLKEEQTAARNLEQYQKKQVEAEASNTVVNYKGYVNKGYLDIIVSDVPNSSIEVAEFKQIRGTDKVSTYGVVCKVDNRTINSKKTNKEYLLSTFIISNYKDSIMVKRFYKESEKEVFEKTLQPGMKVTVQGSIQWDDFAKDVVVMADRIEVQGEDTFRKRFDGQPVKRVELHAHTKMSIMDSILNVDEYVKQAKRYGHTALAVTDHENCHVLPDFFKLATKAGIKPIAGLEGNYINMNDQKIALTDEDIDLRDATFVVFDIETTGFCINFNEIIEIGAVKVKNGMIIDTFSEFVKPKARISDYIAKLTDISNDTVFDALSIRDVLPSFKNFIEGTILVGHNAKFDTEFIYENMRRIGIFEKKYPCIDTIQIARSLYPKDGLKRFNLGACAKFLKVEVEQQHRAIHDARTTNNVFMKMLGDIANKGINNYKDLNKLVDENEIYKYVFPTHLTMLVKNKVGLKNMYKIISDSQTNHYMRYARIVNSVLDEYREGLLIGSGCVNGEVFRAALEKTPEILKEKMKPYDYIEVQPPECYKFLFYNTKDEGADKYIEDTIKLIIKTAKEMGKIVVATGDVHELIPEDSEYRKIYLSIARPNGGGPHELAQYDCTIDMHFRTTSEMLEAFNFLSPDEAYEIVVTNTNKINDMIEIYDLFPKKLFVPRDDFRKDFGVPSMKQAIYDLCDKNAHATYGDVIPQYVSDRLTKELDAIIGHGYFSVYYISHLLVKNSNDHGYVVGSRGSVGSSFVATMMNITEVNALVPHYVCPKCHFSAFKFDEEQKKKYSQPHVSKQLEDILQSVDCGFDLPEMPCPVCGTMLHRDGLNIAFETFLGFTGEKCPDIDLNFSGDYQAQAHLFTQEVFGKDYAFRAGTISTVMDKTAFAYVRDYYANKGIEKRQCELERLALFIAGSKKTTGQHPGGIVVVPDDIDIYDVTPIQFPPVSEKDDLTKIQWRTSHYDYHSFEANLLKLDILGHDDPTLIRKLIEYVQARPNEFPFSTVEGIPFIDDDVISLFSSKDALHINGEDMDKLSSGTIGMPEFGTNFVRGMLETIKPKTYNDIIKVSGLSHGTDVWAGNAEALVQGLVPGFDKVPFNEVIGCRDDIMIFLIDKGVPAADSFKIMEDVRKGRGLKEEQINNMVSHNIPSWFIWTCKKIKYLFPKAHATAYVIMALRIGWFKVHRPIYYYAVYFSVRAKELDAEVFAIGKNAIRNKILELEKKAKDHSITNKEEDLYDELKIALEMVLRGYSFKQISVTHSDATEFVISDDEMSLYLPFIAIDSLGEAVAKSIIAARNERPFSSIKDFERRTQVNKTQFAKLKLLGVFEDLPDDDATSLF